MNDAQFEDDAVRYLCGEMSAAERLRYEAHLRGDARARAESRASGEALAGWAARRCPAIEPTHGAWEALAARLPATSVPESPRWRRLWRSRGFWQAAALILLFLHLGWWVRWETASPARSGDGADPAPEASVVTRAPGSPPASSEGALPDLPALASEVAALRVVLEQRDEEVQILRDRLERALAGRALAVREREALAARLGSFFQPREGRSQLTLIALRPEGASPGNPLEGIESVILDPGRLGVVAGAGAGGSGSFADAGDPGFVPVPEGGDPGAEASPQAGPTAEALAVWRSDLQQGFLNLQGLPVPAEGTQHLLWARESETGPYLPIGVLPVSDGELLLVDFTVGLADFQPREILITEESDRNAEQPAGRVVLIGP
jgi:hypothetical protein